MLPRILFGLLTLTAVGTAAWLTFEPRQPAIAAEKDDEAAIRKAVGFYAESFNKADVNGVMSVWAKDAEYIDDTGTTTSGHDALATLFKKAFEANKGTKVQVKTSKLRFLKNDVALQDGTTTLTAADGDSDTSGFTALWTKNDGPNGKVWQLQQVRELQSESADMPNPKLKDLAWLVGEWAHSDKDFKTTMNVRWMKGGKFLIVELAVHKGNDEEISLIQVIGWDPTGDRLHSWVFDTRGGFGEGYWSRKGTTWTAEVAGVTADGRHGEGTNHYKFVDDDNFTFEGVNRELDGEDLPDVKVTYQRVKKSK